MTERLQEATATLLEAIAIREEELTQLVGDLVKIPSLLGEEAQVQVFVAEHLASSGFAVESWDIEESVKEFENAGESGVSFVGRPNVTGRQSGGDGGRSLILNGHVDVVSPEPVAQWTRDPWGAEIAGRRMYGRGSYDMKSGVALNLWLPRLLNELGISLQGDLSIHSVIEEECTGNGALAASKRERADAAIVTEPSDDSYTAAHLGVIWFRVQVEGRSTHVAHAWQGVNAIVKTAPIVLALRDLDHQLNQRIHPLWAGIQHPLNLNVGVISGGDWPSTVPGFCEIHCRVSLFPDTSLAEMQQMIEQIVSTAAAADAWLREHPPVVVYDGFFTNGCILPPHAPFLANLQAANVRITGKPLQPEIATAVNDMRYYLFEGVPATTFGAAGGNAHAVDEWLDLDSMVPSAQVLGSFILDWCGVA